MKAFAALACLLLLSACSSKPPPGAYRVMGENYFPLKSAEGYAETGVASWYGKKFHGRLTANGERYDMHGRTGAHKTLPFGTIVRVTNLKNGKSADVRINDRGPFVHGRVIDLTKTLAVELDFINEGTARVRLEALGRPKPSVGSKNLEATGFTWQVGSFSSRQNALGLVHKLGDHFADVGINEAVVDGTTVYRVQVGRYTTRGGAPSDGERLKGFDLTPFLVKAK